MDAPQDRFTKDPHIGVGRLAARVLFTLFFAGCKVTGRHHIPADGVPYILALDHSSPIDPALVWAFFPQPVFFLSRPDLHTLPVFGWMCDRTGNIPLAMDPSDQRPMARAVEYLETYRRRLAVFIESPLCIATLAARTKVPVVPVHIAGSGGVLPPGTRIPRFSRDLAIVIGPPLTVDVDPGKLTTPDLEQQTGRIVQAVRALDPEYSRTHEARQSVS